MKNKSAMRCHFTPIKVASINKSTKMDTGQDAQKKKPVFTVDGNEDWYNHCGKQYGDTSKKLKVDLPFDPTIPLLGIYLKQSKTLI